MQPVQANLTGKVAVVTGSNSGIGKETARALGKMGATVVLACRNPERAERARAELTAEGSKIEVMALDLASFASIRTFAEQLARAHSHLDILVNNAGFWNSARAVSQDGIELQWATNVLGPHLLTRLLVPLLDASGHGRVVNLASTAAGGLDLDDVECSKRSFSGVSVYSATKQANRMLTWAWADRLQGKKVTINAMSPGLVNTELNRDAAGVFAVVFRLTKLFAKTAAQGADTAIWLAASPEAEGKTSGFFDNRKEIACKFREAGAVNRLWQICEAQLDRKPLQATA